MVLGSIRMPNGLGPAPIGMATRTEEQSVSAGLTTASSLEAARNPEAANFESLLGDLSAAFVRVSVEEIDAEIERWLQRIVLALNVDRATVVQVDPADGGIYSTHQWAREGVSAPDRGLRTNLAEGFPWLTRRVVSGEVVVISRFEDLPSEASKDVAAARRGGTKSNVTIPLRIGGVIVGAVLFGAIIRERAWSPETVQRLKLVAEIFGNALERKRVEAEIRRLSEELRQVSQVVTMGELTASLAHELNQPLAAIRNNSQAALELLTTKSPDLKQRRYEHLTPRERQVFQLVSAGLLNKQVAAELGTSEQTIKVHRGRVMTKMSAESLAQLARMADRLEAGQVLGLLK